MRGKKLLVRVMVGAVLLSGAWGSRQVEARKDTVMAKTEPRTEARTAAEEPQEGTVSGILVRKRDNGIAVKADGKLEADRYRPRWIGGGYDREMVAQIKAIPVLNRVRLEWALEEHRRVLAIEMIVPEEKEGVVEGTVTARGEHWIEVLPDGEDAVPDRYMPRWIGGMPKDGGGLDKDILRIIGTVNKGDKVRLTWVYDERKRVVELTVTERAPQEPEKRERAERERALREQLDRKAREKNRE